MPERMRNTRRTGTQVTLSVALSGSATLPQTLTPSSYTGFPSTGQGYLYVGNPNVPASIEIIHISDFSTHPWPIGERGADGTTVLAHPITHEVNTGLTESGLAGLVGIYDGRTLYANTNEVAFDTSAFTLTTANGRPRIGSTAGPGRVRSPAERLYLQTSFS